MNCTECDIEMIIIQDNPKIYFCEKCGQTFDEIMRMDINENGGKE